MFRISRFHELLKPISRGAFARAVETTQSDKHTKGFTSWDQLVAMVYAQLSGASSLRQLEVGLNSQRAHHYHLGTQALRRSTLSDANARRGEAVFALTAQTLMQQAERSLRRDARELLCLLDSSSITLKGRGFDDWTAATRTRHTQGIKLHLCLAAPGAVPLGMALSAANCNDINAALTLPLQPGLCYVFDKGYCDYNWWARIDQVGATFVTRFKRNAALRVQHTRPIAPQERATVLGDEIVCFAHRHPGARRINHYTQPLRRITIARPDKPTPLVLATNDLQSAAMAIAQHYRARWQIELFFKWIKQHLRIKQFLGRSENAVRIQILTALIAYLLLAIHRQAHGLKHTLWHLLGELRATLFQRPAIETLWYRRRRLQEQAFAQLQPRLFT